MAVRRDYYEVLGVGRQASAEDLKRAFRKIAMDSHPDRNPDDPAAAARFKEASEAYAVLSDPSRRRSYDLFGHSATDFGGGPAVDFTDMPFGDLFETFFGGGMGGRARRERSTRGDDLRYDLTITFEEAFTGLEKQIEVPRLVTCERCAGSGAEPGTGVETCGTCGGSGQIRRTQQSIFGSVVTASTCPTCGGAGRLLRSPCAVCRGQGRIEKARRLAVKIPAGVDSGSQIRLSGEGEAGIRGGAAGDLYVVLRVKPHAQLARRDKDVIFELRVNMMQAALGDRIEVPTLEGPVEIDIPPGTQYGQSFRLPGRGMPDVRGGRRGDQYVLIQVIVPKDLSADQKAILRKVGGLTGKPEKVSKGFFEKLRDAISLD
ncbi:MAG TPA: molecular chaperone DnaJ [Candidatus Dormibacteraeota bacterium]|nr:molecular chaperone DnaJ [Candidatus Dormibacteraeota bacterium]